MTNTLRTAVASALVAAGLLASASPALAGTTSNPDPQFQDTNLGHSSQVGWCQAVSQSVGAGVIAAGSAAQLDCGPGHYHAPAPGTPGCWGPCGSSAKAPSFQDTNLGHSSQVGRDQAVSQSVGAGVIAAGSAWQG